MCRPETITPFNFGPASLRDQTLYTSERPGADDKNNQPGGTPAAEIQLWVDFMKQQGVKHVITLLEAEELSWYDPPIFETYEREGFTFTHAPFGAEDARARVLAAIRVAEAAGEKIVAHCTHGFGRSGCVAAAWLVDRYDLTLIEATQEAVETAHGLSVERQGEVPRLTKFGQGAPKFARVGE